jgi:hypothetical protein
MIWISRFSFMFAVLVVLAPMAHVLELPNKLRLDAELWLAVQQHLYRGWGPSLGGPTEIGALLTSIWLVYFRWRSGLVLAATVVATAGYVGMLVVFVLLNQPVNVAVASWTPASLPSDWTSYRAQWEAGHAVAAMLSVVSLTALAWAYVKERQTVPRSGQATLSQA